MRNVEVTKDEYNDFLYPAVGGSTAKSEQELETALRVMKKINAPDVTTVLEVPADQLRAAEARGQRLLPTRKLSAPKMELILEEDEWKLVVERLKAYIPQVTLLGAEALYNFLQKLVNADAEDAKESARPQVL